MTVKSHAMPTRTLLALSLAAIASGASLVQAAGPCDFGFVPGYRIFESLASTEGFAPRSPFSAERNRLSFCENLPDVARRRIALAETGGEPSASERLTLGLHADQQARFFEAMALAGPVIQAAWLADVRVQQMELGARIPPVFEYYDGMSHYEARENAQAERLLGLFMAAPEDGRWATQRAIATETLQRIKEHPLPANPWIGDQEKTYPHWTASELLRDRKLPGDPVAAVSALLKAREDFNFTVASYTFSETSVVVTFHDVSWYRDLARLWRGEAAKLLSGASGVTADDCGEVPGLLGALNAAWDDPAAAWPSSGGPFGQYLKAAEDWRRKGVVPSEKLAADIENQAAKLRQGLGRDPRARLNLGNRRLTQRAAVLTAQGLLATGKPKPALKLLMNISLDHPETTTEVADVTIAQMDRAMFPMLILALTRMPGTEGHLEGPWTACTSYLNRLAGSMPLCRPVKALAAGYENSQFPSFVDQSQ